MREYLQDIQAGVFKAISSIIRLGREIFRALVKLSRPIKFLIGITILVEFLVITQWERLPFNQPAPPAPAKTSIASQLPAETLATPPSDKTQDAATDEALAKRLARFEVIDPQVQVNGSILGNGQTVYLHGIKRFDSKNLCTKASGERWACGLHAYATLRNTIAKKTIVCEPQARLPNAVAATCRIGPTNIALVLVSAGLVELDDNAADTELVSAQALAKGGKLGIWDR